MSKKKIKVLKKKKVKKIKKKIEIKEIKKIGSKLKTNLEDSEAELNDENFSQALQHSKSPVLEQIAVAQRSNLENIIPIRKNDSEESLDSGLDYTQLGRLNDEENKYHESSPNYDEMTNLDKDERERRRNLDLINPGRKKDSSERGFEFENDSKKYVNKGDYKQ